MWVARFYILFYVHCPGNNVPGVWQWKSQESMDSTTAWFNKRFFSNKCTPHHWGYLHEQTSFLVESLYKNCECH